MTVQLTTVWVWTCPECSRRNIEDPPPDEEASAELAEEMGDEYDSIEVAVMPSTVLCDRCMGLFDVEVPEMPRDDWGI